MKKTVVLILCAVLFLTCACASKPSKTVVTLVDYFDSRNMPSNSIEKDLPEFPGVVFRWSSSEFAAIKDGVKTVLVQGMPVWSVFAADLNGDNLPELCATISFGSGVIDNRVIIVDYANDKLYEISARMQYDYHLSNHDNKLIIIRNPYSNPDNSKSRTGSLSIKNQQLFIEYTTGETERIDAAA